MIDLATPKVTTDAAIVEKGRIVLVRRRFPPFKDCWALPGGFVEVGETVEAACVREAREETGLAVEVVRLVGVYSDPGRDPRGHTVGVAYLCAMESGDIRGGDDAKEARWFGFGGLPALAFDHGKILNDVKALVSGD
jgi:8-oxo-dGTP diphosphatase